MPDITICETCGDAHWADKRCPTCERKKVREDAALLGAGYMRILADGSVERIDPASIYLKDTSE